MTAPTLQDNNANGAGADLSATMRGYLAEIYRLGDREEVDQPFISTSALADLLDVSAPAVNRMVGRLRELGYLQHEPYQGIRLTPPGEREALKQLRKQRIVEAFLVQVMGFGWHEIHAEADAMSHALDPVVIQRMYTMAGQPTRCPHGEPIPTEAGEVVAPPDELLTEAPHNTVLTITRVRTRETDRLEYLSALGLVPSAHIEIIHAAPFNGPLQIHIGKEYRIVGHNLAEMLRVEAG